MPTVILARHGRTTANTGGVLAGRSPGVHLDEHGREQVTKAAERLTGLPLAAVVCSPMERCRETAALLVPSYDVTIEPGLDECDYGAWSGRPIKQLVKEKLWRTVQAHPAGVIFPEGEAMAEMSRRGVAAIRDWDRRVAAEHGDDAVWLAISHGDVIKAILADALGTHLDQFQRIVVDPASLSVITYTDLRPFVRQANTHAGSLAHLAPAKKRARRRRTPGDAVVGGGAGPEPTA